MYRLKLQTIITFYTKCKRDRNEDFMFHLKQKEVIKGSSVTKIRNTKKILKIR